MPDQDIADISGLPSSSGDNASTACEFEYKPLESGKADFRLLILESGSWDSDIRCKLEPSCFSTAKPYAALSYLWGDKNDCGQIWLGNCQHEVTKNLDDALRHLRSPSEQKTLWVDALCINQGDIAEREQQVGRMHTIYTQAATVLAWTGTASENSNEGLDILERFAHWVLENEDAIFDPPEDEPSANVPVESLADRISRLGFPVEKQNWNYVWDFLDRPYWTRVWVIQELAVRGKYQASKPCTIICGQRQLDKSLFETGCAGLLALVMPSSQAANVSASGDMSEPIKSLLLRGRGHPPGLAMCQVIWACNPDRSTPLLNWLQAVTWRFNATDDRDKIYALLGLVRQEDRAVEPNYTKPTSEVLADFVKFFVDRDRSLESMYTNRRHRCSTTPTWVPEIHYNHHASELILGGEHNLRLYNACGSRPADAYFDQDKKILGARGVVIGLVDRTIGPWEEGAESGNTFVDTADLMKKRAYQDILRDLVTFSETIAADSDVYESFWRVLVADRKVGDIGGDDMEPAPQEYRQLSQMYFGLRDLPEDICTGLPATTRRQTITAPFWVAMTKAVTNRTFIKSENNYMGLGPYLAQAGDLLVVLFGSRIPFVLRPVISGMHEVIGTAYVHGVMHGEMFQPGSMQEEQVFRLC